MPTNQTKKATAGKKASGARKSTTKKAAGKTTAAKKTAAKKTPAKRAGRSGTATRPGRDGARVIEGIEDVEQSSLDAVRRFVDAVDEALPDLVQDGVRRRVIDAAFDMTQDLVGASNRLARNVLDATERELEGARERLADARETARRAPAKARAAAKKRQ